MFLLALIQMPLLVVKTLAKTAMQAAKRIPQRVKIPLITALLVVHILAEQVLPSEDLLAPTGWVLLRAQRLLLTKSR